jgi:hypothetical protein
MTTPIKKNVGTEAYRSLSTCTFTMHSKVRDTSHWVYHPIAKLTFFNFKNAKIPEVISLANQAFSQGWPIDQNKTQNPCR